jgi:hypothetical protein
MQHLSADGEPLAVGDRVTLVNDSDYWDYLPGVISYIGRDPAWSNDIREYVFFRPDEGPWRIRAGEREIPDHGFGFYGEHFTKRSVYNWVWWPYV